MNPDFLIARAAQMRREPTYCEKLILDDLQMRGFIFQKVFHRYILDFYHPRTKINVELDGKTHFTKAGRRRNADKLRDAFLAREGILVLRYLNIHVQKDRQGVIQAIDDFIRIRSSS